MKITEPARRLAVIVGAWLVTRVAVLAVSRVRALYPFQDDPFEIGVFARWGAAFAGSERTPVPLREAPWEYPIGAVPVVLIPALLDGVPYVVGFVGQMLLWDLALLVLLAVVGLRRGSPAGAWLWVAAVPLLGPVALARFDVVATALAVAGLAGPGFLAGVLLASGGAVKVWPALLLPLVMALRRGGARVLAGAATVGLVTLGAAAAYGALPRLLSFLTYQRDRGLEVESLPALPLMLARTTGDERVTVGFEFGSYQVDGPWADTMLTAGSVGMFAVVLLTAGLAVRARRRDAVLPLAVLLMAGGLLVDKVLSAQYQLWITGLVALALCTPGSPLRAAVLPLVGVLLLTQLVYPLSIDDLVAGHLRPVLLLVARDLLLLVVAVIAGVASWRAPLASVRSAAPAADSTDASG